MRFRWKKIKNYKLIPKVLERATFVDGELPDEEEQVAYIKDGARLAENPSTAIDKSSRKLTVRLE